MLTEENSSFAFMVVTYNHQDYILEHLESIKFLIIAYGKHIEVDLIVNDDYSKDNTRTLIDQWLTINVGIFRSVEKIYSTKNLGTCTSVSNMLQYLAAQRCKLTAGDDVYSYENIFELSKCEPGVAIVSGQPLYLLGDNLVSHKISDCLAIATQIIYTKDSLLHRFKHFSYNNAPNIVYSTECIKKAGVIDFLNRFDVTEDWPLQVAIARLYPSYKFNLIDKVLVYYRRTTGSTFIVANQRFVRDKIMMYDDLINNEEHWIEKTRLRSRKYCFKSNNKMINKLFNLDLYFFALSCVLHAKKIFTKVNSTHINLERHRHHYSHIKSSALLVRKVIDS